MTKKLKLFPTILLTGTTLGLAACGGGHDTYANPDSSAASTTPAATTPAVTTPTTTTAAAPDTLPAKHHSKLAGAAAGAVVGHMLGGHAVAGAAAGALIQHERNKHVRY